MMSRNRHYIIHQLLDGEKDKNANTLREKVFLYVYSEPAAVSGLH